MSQAVQADIAGKVVAAQTVSGILTERGNTHGVFADNARISQQLKDYYKGQLGYASLTDIQREALDNIAIKISRILSGGGRGGNWKDNWDDIAGYATLASQELSGQ